nr:AraC family transcriptional regulator [Paenibacillus caui]
MIADHGYVWDGRNRSGDHCILQYTLSGRGEIEIEGKTHRLERGDAFLVDVPGNHVYRLPADSEAWEVLYIELSHDALAYLRELAAAGTGGTVFKIEPDSALVELLWATYREAVHDSYRDIYQCSRAAYSLVMLLASHLERKRGSASLPPAVEKCKQFLDEHYSEPIGLDDMAAASSRSKFHLSREFERVMGATPGRYLTKVRLERASVLLLSPEEWNLEEIAGMTGFANANYFGKVFRKFTGMSPGEFRKRSDRYEIRRMLFQS